MIDSTTFLLKELNDLETIQTRFILKNGKRISSPILDKLNQASIMEKGEDFNILSTITKYSIPNKRIVEMPIKLNYINIYSLDGSFSKSICLEKKPFNITTIIKTKFRNRIYTFLDLRIFDDFFGVVFINEEAMAYQTSKVKLPSILLFNWDGVPLAELKLESHITDFDIDLINKKLYTFDLHSDDFFKYDIEHILTEL